jgi:DNA-directed RNA polymerase specialized sigma24 family protein
MMNSKPEMPDNSSHGRSAEFQRRRDEALEEVFAKAERDPELSRLLITVHDVVMKHGPRVGARYGLGDDDMYLTKLLENCLAKIEQYDPQRGSLRTYINGFAMRTAVSRLRELKHLPVVELPRDDVLAITPRESPSALPFLDDDPIALQGFPDADVRNHIEGRRPAWRVRRDTLWTEATNATSEENFWLATKCVERVALYDVMLDTATSRLIVPWMYYCCRLDRPEIASRVGMERGAVDKLISRFKKRVKLGSDKLKGKLGLPRSCPCRQP